MERFPNSQRTMFCFEEGDSFFFAVALKTKSFSYLFGAFNVIAFRNQRPIHSNLCGNPTKIKEKSQRVNHINRLKKYFVKCHESPQRTPIL